MRCEACGRPLLAGETAVCGECVDGVGWWPALPGERDEEGELVEERT